MYTTLRILIVENHPLLATAMTELLQRQFPNVSATVVDAAPAAIEQAAAVDWFRIFVDPSVSRGRELALLRKLEELGVIARCCLVTAFKGSWLFAEARRLGVLGYIDKRWSVPQLRRSLYDIMRNLPVFPTSFEHRDPESPQLTSRQLAVLRLLQQGMSSKQVAQELRIAEGTVKNHSLAVLRALGAANRAHAVARGLQLGLLQQSLQTS